MANDFSQLFAQIVKQHGSIICDKPMTLNSLLADYSRGEHRKGRHLLIWILETGCINTLTADQDYEAWRKECAEIMNTEFYIDKEKSMSMLGILYSILLRDKHLQKRANYLFKSNEYEQANCVFDEILRVTPDSIFALLGKGNVAVKKQNYDDVIKYFENVIELDSQKTNLVTKDLGAAYWVEGNKAKNEQKYIIATDCLTKAMFYDAENTAKVEPILVETYYLQAASELDEKDYIAANNSITSAMQYTHDNKTLVRLLIKRAETNELLGAYINAMSDYDEALTIDNASIHIYEKRSRLYFKREEYDAALCDCDTILRLDSRNISAMYHKGIILEKQDDIFKAQDLVHEALRLNPEPELRRKMDIRLQAINIKIAEYYESCGDKYLVAKDYNNAYREYSKAIDTIPSNGKLFMKRGDTSKLLNNNDSAKKDYEQSLLLLNDEAEISAANGFLKLIANDYQAAAVYLQKAEVSKVFSEEYLRPSLVEAFYGMGNTAFNNKNYGDSIRWLQKAIYLKPECFEKIEKLLGDAYWNEGTKFSEDKLYVEAANCFNNAIRYNTTYKNINESDLISRSYRISAYKNHTDKNYAQAIKYYTLALKYLPADEHSQRASIIADRENAYKYFQKRN